MCMIVIVCRLRMNNNLKTNTEKLKILNKSYLITLILILFFSQFCRFLGTDLPKKVAAQNLSTSESTVQMGISEDIFISPSTANGNRRMLFAGTYIDYTVCGPEGCPPTYMESFSLLKFNLSSLPVNAIVLSARLKLFHYGSNSDITLKISKVDETWSESTAFPGPRFSGDYGQSIIPNFNTTDPDQIAEREISLDLNLFDDLSNLQNGIAISPVNELDTPGVVFCSNNPDGFCQNQHRPKLEISYLPNNAPEKPVMINPVEGSRFGGSCDMSQLPPSSSCNISQTIIFQAGNIIDNDPLSGALSHANIQIFKEGNIFLSSPNINPDSNKEIKFTTDLEDGIYTVKTISTDKKNMSISSDNQNIVIDSTPPSVPLIDPLATITKPSNNQINLQIKSAIATDNISLSPEIKYKLQYSNDSAFQRFVETEWQSNPEFTLTNNEISPDQNYFFRIKSKDFSGNISDWSDTAATSIDGLPKTPFLDKANWGINDGIKADGYFPERNRFNTSTFVTRSGSQKLTGKALQNNQIEIYINNKLVDKVIANQNCKIENTKNICDFNYDLKFTDNGANNLSGTPINSYGIQLRAIDENNNFSLLSPKEIIYHDTISPKIERVSIYTEKQDLNDSSITNGSKLTLDIIAEKYSDLEFKLINSAGKIVDYLVWRTPANKTTKLTADLKLDGNYRVQLTSFDAAGNRSTTWEKGFVRDTTAPKIIDVIASECSQGVCIKINAENGAKIFIDNKSYGQLSDTNHTFKVINYYRTDYYYRFKIQLQDEVGNISTPKEIEFYKVYGGGGATNNDIDLAKKSPRELELKIKNIPEIYIDIDGNVKVSNPEVFQDNAPVLVDAFKNLIKNNETTVYGYGLSDGKTMDAQSEVKLQVYMGLGDALEKCELDFLLTWIGDYLKENCVKKYSSKNMWDVFSNIALFRIQCVFQNECIKKKFNEYSPQKLSEDKRSITYKVDLISSKVFINEFCFDGCESSISSGSSYFDKAFSNEQAPEGSIAVSRSKIAYSFRYLNSTFKFESLTSTSNEITIPSATYAFNYPVGFPFRNFKLVTEEKASNIKSIIGADRIQKICNDTKIQCTNSYSKPGDLRAERGSYDMHINAIDFNVYGSRSESGVLTPVFATADGEIQFNKAYGYFAYNRVTQKCEGYDAISLTITTKDGYQVIYYHLSPKTLELEMWKNSHKYKTIKRGDLVGFMGNTGCSEAVHLHYQIENLSLLQIKPDKGKSLTKAEIIENERRLKITTEYLYNSFTDHLGTNFLIEDLTYTTSKKEIDAYMKAYLEGKTRNDLDKLTKF